MKFITLVLCLQFSIGVLAQKKNWTVKPYKKDLESTEYSNDPKAAAAILYESCETSIIYNDDIKGEEGFFAETESRTRIKIYKKEGLKWSKDSLFLFINEQVRTEKLINLSIITHNLVNGKMVKSNLAPSEIQSKRIGNEITAYVFQAPDVEIGSIVDIKYRYRSPYLYDIKDWNFQSKIPKRWSSYSFIRPDYFDYKSSTKGYIKIETKQNTNLNNLDKVNNRLATQYSEVEDVYWASDVPALYPVPYLSTHRNYASQISFILTGYQLPNGINFRKADTWQQIGQRLIASVHFGAKLDQNQFLNKDIEALVEGIEDPKEKAIKVYDYIKKYTTWNGRIKLFCDQNLSRVYENKNGSATEINLLLVLALRTAGIDAYPIVLRTRARGIIDPLKPSIRKFNYTIAGFQLEDKTLHYLDATAPSATLDLLPPRCLNGEGFKVVKYGEWLTLPNKMKDIESYVSVVNLSEEGKVEGECTYSAKNHGAYNFREKWEHLQNDRKKSIRWEMDKAEERIKIHGCTFKNLDDLNKTLEVKMMIRVKESTESNNTQLSFNPIFIGRIYENPFKDSTRIYPIEFDTPLKRSFVLTINLPEGYQIEHLPKAEIVKLPSKGGKFSYNAVAVGENKIQIVCAYNINQTYFGPQNYSYIKAYFDAMVLKQSENIILSKK